MARQLFSLLALALLAACAQNPATGNLDFVLMSEYEEIALGKAGDAAITRDYGVYSDSALQQYVDGVGQRLAGKSHRNQIAYHFKVLDTPQINAFAMPGGYVYITRGMLAYLNSEAELVAVLGHEIGHITARHSVREYTSSAAFAVGASFIPGMGSDTGRDLVEHLNKAITLGYSREHEIDADRLSAEYLARSGYDPQAMTQVIQVLKGQEIFEAQVAKQEGREAHSYHGAYATHPDNDTRLVEVIKQAQALAQPQTAVRREEFLARLNGLHFGNDVQHGVIKDGVFYHAGHGLALRLPDAWRGVALADLFVAQSPDKQVLLTLNQLDISFGSAAELLHRLLLLDDEEVLPPAIINGMPAAISNPGSDGASKFAIVKPAADQAYVIAARADLAEAFEPHLAEINQIISSVRPLTPAEYRLAKPQQVKALVAAPGLTYAQLASESVLDKNAEIILRLLNGAYPAGEPVAGQTLKIIE